MTSIQPDKGPVFISPDKFRHLPDVITTDTPENRIRHMTLVGEKALYAMTPRVNRLVAENTPFMCGRVGEVIVKSVRSSGLHSTLGIDYVGDLVDEIYPYAATLAREVATSDIDETEKLRWLANMTGTMIVEAQSFSVGNKRTARTMYGRILYGRSGMALGYNEDIDFGPPTDIDRQVMLQSVARLRAERDGTVTPRLLGGVYVDADVEKSIANAAESVQAFCFRYGRQETEGTGDVAANILRLKADLEGRIPNKQVRNRVINILFQEDYGPAVVSLVFDNPCDIFEQLSTQAIVDLVETNTRLLKLRLKAFMAAAACGGYFVSIEDANEEGRTRQIVKTKWEPEAAPIDYNSPKHSTVRV